MEIFIREIEEKDYFALLSLWNNELGNGNVTTENIILHYERIKNDDRYKTYVALFEKVATTLVCAAVLSVLMLTHFMNAMDLKKVHMLLTNGSTP